nr:MAG TPA: hypothetical protein [Caudoviricetes sp.]
MLTHKRISKINSEGTVQTVPFPCQNDQLFTV